MAPKVLQLQSMGGPAPTQLMPFVEPLAQHLVVTATVSKTNLPNPTYAFNKDRKQYHVNAILRRLKGTLPPGASFLLAMTDVDLFAPDTPFVFGDADRDARVALVSMVRLSEGATPDGVKRRLTVEVLHQAGHLVGLSYCEDARCIMYSASSLAECDRKNLGFCNLCRNELAKLAR
jgi:archaemetzincin